MFTYYHIRKNYFQSSYNTQKYFRVTWRGSKLRDELTIISSGCGGSLQAKISTSHNITHRAGQINRLIYNFTTKKNNLRPKLHVDFKPKNHVINNRKQLLKPNVTWYWESIRKYKTFVKSSILGYRYTTIIVN